MLRNKSNTYSTFLTLAYSDIFDYPLKEGEINKYLIKNQKSFQPLTSHLKIQLLTSNFSPPITYKDGFFSLKGREDIIDKRIEREHISKKKIIFAQKIASILKCIPTIQLIGLSGSLAMLNADEADDIDLFIIAKYKTLWITRLAVLSVLQLFDVRRTRKAKKTQDAVCTNMFVDESRLLLPKRMQNLYTAHEVVQMKPVFVKNDMDRRFLEANEWIREYLPNAVSWNDIKILRYKDIKRGNDSLRFFPNILISQYPNILESVSKSLQLWYMSKHRTTEIITDTLLAFHPQDQSKYVLGEFEKRIKNIL